MATQHQVIDIRLPSGLILRDAVGLLCVKFGQWPWGRFDGISPADPNTIMDADVDISFSGARARSNVPRALYKARIQEKRDELTAFLRAIPADVGLEDEGLELASLREPIVGLYDCLAGLEGVKLANATKMTYRPRMRLLPVLDSALQNYYWYATSICDEERFLELRAIASWGRQQDLREEEAAESRSDLCPEYSPAVCRTDSPGDQEDRVSQHLDPQAGASVHLRQQGARR